jgi:hypothetical protein
MTLPKGPLMILRVRMMKSLLANKASLLPDLVLFEIVSFLKYVSLFAV